MYPSLTLSHEFSQGLTGYRAHKLYLTPTGEDELIYLTHLTKYGLLRYIYVCASRRCPPRQLVEHNCTYCYRLVEPTCNSHYDPFPLPLNWKPCSVTYAKLGGTLQRLIVELSLSQYLRPSCCPSMRSSCAQIASRSSFVCPKEREAVFPSVLEIRSRIIARWSSVRASHPTMKIGNCRSHNLRWDSVEKARWMRCSIFKGWLSKDPEILLR